MRPYLLFANSTRSIEQVLTWRQMRNWSSLSLSIMSPFRPSSSDIEDLLDTHPTLSCASQNSFRKTGRAIHFKLDPVSSEILFCCLQRQLKIELGQDSFVGICRAFPNCHAWDSCYARDFQCTSKIARTELLLFPHQRFDLLLCWS